MTDDYSLRNPHRRSRVTDDYSPRNPHLTLSKSTFVVLVVRRVGGRAVREDVRDWLTVTVVDSSRQSTHTDAFERSSSNQLRSQNSTKENFCVATQSVVQPTGNIDLQLQHQLVLSRPTFDRLSVSMVSIISSQCQLQHRLSIYKSFVRAQQPNMTMPP